MPVQSLNWTESPFLTKPQLQFLQSDLSDGKIEFESVSLFFLELALALVLALPLLALPLPLVLHLQDDPKQAGFGGSKQKKAWKCTKLMKK